MRMARITGSSWLPPRASSTAGRRTAPTCRLSRTATANSTDLYRIRTAGGEEQRLTSAPAHDDGSDYSPDGRWIYFNSDRAGGGGNIWRIPVDGGGPNDERAERITNDALEDWFPHPSPDGRKLLFLSFPAGTRGHSDRTLRVQLRMIDMPGDKARDVAPQVVVELIGGQGTINVNSWSPDSTKFSYVTFEAVPPGAGHERPADVR